MEQWSQVASQQTVERTIAALKVNNISAEAVADGDEAKKRVLELIPEGAEVKTMTSETLREIGLEEEINSSAKFKSVRRGLAAEENQSRKRQLGAAPEWVVGSVHAVTEDGHVLIASQTGSQLPAYSFGAAHVIWVVGAQKIVKDLDAGLARIYEYVLPLESERAKKAYGVAGSAVNKLLVVNKEVSEGRIHLIFILQSVGF